MADHSVTIRFAGERAAEAEDQFWRWWLAGGPGGGDDFVDYCEGWSVCDAEYVCQRSMKRIDITATEKTEEGENANED